MARPKRTNMEYLVDFMKNNPDATYAEAAAACKRGGKKVFPIMWGRAQVMLGRKVAKKKSKKAADAADASSGPAKRRGRPPGSKNRPKGKATRTPAPRTAQSSNSDGVAISIGNDQELATWVGIVNNLNQGGKVALRYDGGQWMLAEA